MQGRKRPVPCEKPTCIRVGDCRAVVDKARESALPVWVAMECRCMPAIRQLLEEVDCGRAGTLRMEAIREHRHSLFSKGRRLEPLPSSNRLHAGREMPPFPGSHATGAPLGSGSGVRFRRRRRQPYRRIPRRPDPDIRLLKTPWTGKNGIPESKSPLRSPSLCVTFPRPGRGSAAGWHTESSFSTA